MSSSSKFEVTLADIQEAKNELSKYLQPSPCIMNPWLSETFGCKLYLKLENMQPIGSFKIRGATYRISRLSSKERKRGVVAASAGNHAQGVAWGSRQLGVSALIVMPKGASLVKVQNTRALGAEVVLEGETYDEAYDAAQRIARKSGRVYIHAFEDPIIVAGAGTVGLEILETVPDVDIVVAATGGGGLMAGVSTVIKELRPQARIIGCQASGSPSMIRSVKAGHAIRLQRVDTFADGIAIAQASEKIRRILSRTVDQWLEADDEAIATGVLNLLEKAKIIAEGSGALPLAVLEKIRKQIRGKKVVLVISGGNIDVNILSRIIDRGLIQAGRRVRLNVQISDRVGSLARLTALIANEGASVIQAIHDRNELSTAIDETEVALTLETRGPEHSAALIKKLRQHVLRLDLAH